MSASELAAGYAALVSGAAAVRLDRDAVRVGGPDAIAFLQGQLSQDVVALSTGSSAWSLLLQPQGKVDAWLRVTRISPDEVVLDVDGGWGEAVIARLTRFRLRTKAEIEPLAWRCVALRGPGAPADLATPPTGTAVVAGARWPLVGGVDLLGLDPAVPDGMPEVGVDAFEVRRIEAGLPRMGAELTERTIPAEAGVVESSVSFTKGCYTGQELVARIDSRGGHVPRLLRSVVLEGIVADGSPLEVDGRVVGALTSVAAHPDGHAVGLASVRRDVEPPAAALCAGVPASVRSLPRP